MPGFRLEIVTPQRVQYGGEVESFWAPGVEGNFQVLAGHIPFMTVLQVGEISFRETNGRRRYTATSGGFVEVLRTGVTVVAETAEFAEEIDVRRAEGAKNRARERLRKPEPGTDIDRATAALARALNRLQVAERR
jgi:F-type H+-transporting ATPase subunit epsilon